MKGRAGWLAGIVCAVVPAFGVEAQDAPAIGWTNSTELTAVWTAGNSPASTFGLKNDLRRTWQRSSVRLEAGALRTESTTRTRSARGTGTDFVVAVTESSAVTAESYLLRGRYDRELGARTFLFGGAGWTRNTFAGIQNRYAFVAGAGNRWIDREGTVFKTDYGLTYTVQDDVVDDPCRSDSFAGLRLSAEAARPISESAKLATNLTVDESLSETDDLRADWTGSLAVTVSGNVALKTSLQVLFDNQPSLASIPLRNPAGDPAGNVTAPLDEFDSVFTVALVLSF